MTEIILAPRFSTIDLSGLAPPDVIEVLDYEAIVTAIRDDLVARFPLIAGVIDLESEPARKLIEAFAYRELGLRARVNDAARAVMLAYAFNNDLEHIGARYSVARLEGEDDERFRRRISIAPEAMSVAGPEGAYQFHALSADVNIHDVSVYSDRPGRVLVTVMMAGADPVPSQDVLLNVRAVINSKTVRPLTDEVTVVPPQVIRTPINVSLTLYPGPSAITVKTLAEAALARLVTRVHFLGYDLKQSAIYAAAHEGGGVHGVTIATPAADIVTTPRQLVVIEGVTVTTLGRDI